MATVVYGEYRENPWSNVLDPLVGSLQRGQEQKFQSSEAEKERAFQAQEQDEELKAKEAAAKVASEAAKRKQALQTGEDLFKDLRNQPSTMQGPLLETIGSLLRYGFNDKKLDLGTLFEPNAKWNNVLMQAEESSAESAAAQAALRTEQMQSVVDNLGAAEKRTAAKAKTAREKTAAETDKLAAEAAKIRWGMTEEGQAATKKSLTSSQLNKEVEAERELNFKNEPVNVNNLSIDDYEKRVNASDFDPNTAGPAGEPMTDGQVSFHNTSMQKYGLDVAPIVEGTEGKWWLPKSLEAKTLEMGVSEFPIGSAKARLDQMRKDALE